MATLDGPQKAAPAPSRQPAPSSTPNLSEVSAPSQSTQSPLVDDARKAAAEKRAQIDIEASKKNISEIQKQIKEAGFIDRIAGTVGGLEKELKASQELLAKQIAAQKAGATLSQDDLRAHLRDLNQAGQTYSTAIDRLEKAENTTRIVRNTAVAAGVTIATGGTATAMAAAGFGGAAAFGGSVVVGMAAGTAIGTGANIAENANAVNLGMKTLDQAFNDAKQQFGQDLKTSAITAVSAATGSQVAGAIVRGGATASAAVAPTVATRIVAGVGSGLASGTVSTAIGTADRYHEAVNQFNQANQGYEFASAQARQEALHEYLSQRGLNTGQIIKNGAIDILTQGLSAGLGAKGNVMGGVGGRTLDLAGAAALGLGAEYLKKGEVTFQDLAQGAANAVNGYAQGRFSTGQPDSTLTKLFQRMHGDTPPAGGGGVALAGGGAAAAVIAATGRKNDSASTETTATPPAAQASPPAAGRQESTRPAQPLEAFNQREGIADIPLTPKAFRTAQPATTPEAGPVKPAVINQELNARTVIDGVEYRYRHVPEGPNRPEVFYMPQELLRAVSQALGQKAGQQPTAQIDLQSAAVGFQHTKADGKSALFLPLPDPGKEFNRSAQVEFGATAKHEMTHARGGGEAAAYRAEGGYRAQHGNWPQNYFDSDVVVMHQVSRGGYDHLQILATFHELVTMKQKAQGGTATLSPEGTQQLFEAAAHGMRESPGFMHIGFMELARKSSPAAMQHLLSQQTDPLIRDTLQRAIADAPGFDADALYQKPETQAARAIAAGVMDRYFGRNGNTPQHASTMAFGDLSWQGMGILARLDPEHGQARVFAVVRDPTQGVGLGTTHPKQLERAARELMDQGYKVEIDTGVYSDSQGTRYYFK